jgi:hypothetical protein
MPKRKIYDANRRMQRIAEAGVKRAAGTERRAKTLSGKATPASRKAAAAKRKLQAEVKRIEQKRGDTRAAARKDLLKRKRARSAARVKRKK